MPVILMYFGQQARGGFIRIDDLWRSTGAVFRLQKLALILPMAPTFDRVNARARWRIAPGGSKRRGN